MHVEERFTWRHARVTRRFELADALDMEEKLPEGDADGELYEDQLLVTERVAAARPDGAIRLNDVIERIIACDNLERPISQPARMPEPPTPQPAGTNGLNAHLPTFRRHINSFDKYEPVRPVWPPRRIHLVLKDGDYKQKSDAEPESPRSRNKCQTPHQFVNQCWGRRKRGCEQQLRKWKWKWLSGWF